MTPVRTTLARTMVRFAEKVVPERKADWIVAMASELDYVPEREAIRFAAGCILCAVRAQTSSAAFVLVAAKWALIMGALTWSAMHINLAGRLAGAGQHIFLYALYCIAAIFAAGAIVTMRGGLRAMTRLGLPFLALLVIAALSNQFWTAPLPEHSNYVALLVEDISIMLLALGIAFSAKRLAKARKAQGL